MIDWKEANKAIGEAYGVSVPDYDLKPVLEFISVAEPRYICSAISECIIMLTDEMLIGHRRNNARTQNMMEVLKMIFRTFDSIDYDSRAFSQRVCDMIDNGTKGDVTFAGEPDFLYPRQKDI